MGKWTELSDAITELLLNSDYIADEVSNNNDGINTRNDRNMNDNNNDTDNNGHSERTSSSDEHIPVNDENTSNNNNDQNSTITTTHIDGLQLPKDANIVRKRKISSMSKPYQNKRISNGTSKRDMSSSKKKTSHQFNKKMISNQIYLSPIRFDHVSQEIFCDACGTSVSWSNIVDLILLTIVKIVYVMKRMVLRYSKARKKVKANFVYYYQNGSRTAI